MKKLLVVPMALLVVATTGYSLISAAEPEGTYETITVVFVSKGKALKTEDALLHNPDLDKPIRVSVDRGDRIVWRGVDIDQDKDIQGFTVWLEPLTPGAPVSPFFGGEIVTVGNTKKAKWTTSNGKVETGPARPTAKHHWYKSTIEVADKDRLDPHIIFD